MQHWMLPGIMYPWGVSICLSCLGGKSPLCEWYMFWVDHLVPRSQHSKPHSDKATAWHSTRVTQNHYWRQYSWFLLLIAAAFGAAEYKLISCAHEKVGFSNGIFFGTTVHYHCSTLKPYQEGFAKPACQGIIPWSGMSVYFVFLNQGGFQFFQLSE